MRDDSVLSFGEEHDTRSRGLFKQPYIVFAHLAFRVGALVIYFVSTSLSSSFIICFLLIICLLSVDFWTVKNISGRLLVGLRWWNFVDSEGTSHWRFESRKDQTCLNVHEVRMFWAALVVCPVLWSLLAFLCLFSLKPAWLIVCVMAVSMSGANLYGYLRCKWNSRQELTSYMSQTLFKSMLTRASTSKTPGREATVWDEMFSDVFVCYLVWAAVFRIQLWYICALCTRNGFFVQ